MDVNPEGLFLKLCLSSLYVEKGYIDAVEMAL